MNWRRWLIGLIVVVVLAAGGFFAYRQFFAPEPEEDVVTSADVADVNTVAVDTGVGVVSAEGTVVPLREAMLSFVTGGQVAEIVAPTGTVVAAGDPILRLDATDQQIAVTQAEAALETAQAALATAQAGRRAAETGQQAAAVGVQAAEVELALVTAQPTAEEIALREAAIAAAEATINQAGANQTVVLEGANSSEIASAEARLRAAEAQLLPVREQLDVLRREDSPDADALAQAERRYNAAVANVNAAQAALDELQAGATSGQRQAASGGVAAAAAQRDAAQAQLDLLLAGARQEEVTAAEAGVAQAEASLAEAELAVAQADAAIAQAEAGVTQAEAAVEAARDALEQMTLTAPFAGTVADVMVEAGEVVSAGAPVVALGDLDGWLVKTTDLTELDVVALRVGSPVEISIDAIPGETLTGSVVDIATNSTLVRGDVTYEVTIALDDAADLPLRWGMTVFVDVNVDGE